MLKRQRSIRRTALFATTAVIMVAALGALGRGWQGTPKSVGIAIKNGVPMQPPSTNRFVKCSLQAPESGVIPGALVERDSTTGQIRRVRGIIVVPRAGTPLDVALGVLKTNASVFGLSANLSEIKEVREETSLIGYHITFQQVYSGLPVFGGSISVNMDPNLAVTLINHDLIPISRVVAVPAPVNSASAILAAIQAVNAGNARITPPVAEAGIYVQNGMPIPVWKISFVSRTQHADWEVMVGVGNRVVSYRNIAQYVDGVGNVFNPSPVQSSGNPYLADNNNQDSPELTAQLISKTLQGLNGTGYLQGAYCSTDLTSTSTLAYEPTEQFNYTRSNDKFDEVMVYFNIDSIERYIQSLGIMNVNNRVVEADANTKDNVDNSFYSPSTKCVYFGDGGVDDAQDADVIWHEMGHCIQDNEVPGWGQTEEGGAMGEGWGDYWAGSHEAAIGGPKSPGWDVYIAKWDAVSYNPGNPAYLRRLDSTKHYPGDMDYEVHDDGEMWSASLWQIRSLVGKQRADTMILQSHFLLSPTAVFVDGANAILQANTTLYGGADQAAIRKIFQDRGILSPPPPPPVLRTFWINNGSLFTNSLNVALTNKVMGTATYYMASESPTFDGASWTAYSTAPSFALSTGDGVKTVYFKVKNESGTSGVLSDTINLVEYPVVTNFAMNGGATSTSSRTVTLDNLCTGNPTLYQASEYASFSSAKWLPYGTSPTFTLSSYAGTKRVYLRVRNAKGVSPSVNATITYSP